MQLLHLLLFGFLAVTMIATMLLVAFVLPAWGAVSAFRNDDTRWGIAVIATWALGVGWLVALAYLLGPGRERRNAPVILPVD